jgi:adenosylcobinamide-GDP ribazoletransferase
MVTVAWFSPYARMEGGLAAPFLAHLSWRHVVVSTGVLTSALIIGLGLQGAAVVMVVGIGLVLTVWAACRTWFGGVTGDTLGAANELIEILFLLLVPLLVLLS